MLSHKLFLFVFIIFTPIFFSCTKTQQPDADAIKATLNNYTGLDGCSWVIKLKNNEVLEPINLADFDLDLKEGKKIWIKYKPAPNYASICMVGQMVEIEAIWER